MHRFEININYKKILPIKKFSSDNSSPHRKASCLSCNANQVIEFCMITSLTEINFWIDNNTIIKLNDNDAINIHSK